MTSQTFPDALYCIEIGTLATGPGKFKALTENRGLASSSRKLAERE